MHAEPKEIIEQAEYILTLARRIRLAAESHEVNTRRGGTIYNLSPELSKAASQLRKMIRWGWKE